ncbi:hypothetical protein FSP39_009092 [Pinctada imbricata]|uniref:BTB domain-containing protein n=1 Tax=Pinctada imbricata TaxID=66713 RepID=A0AA88XKW5_PINIB|nr:hypothetical protein FSP39_009092 [Pinctada imbricata]
MQQQRKKVRKTENGTEGQTDGRTDRQTDRQTKRKLRVPFGVAGRGLKTYFVKGTAALNTFQPAMQIVEDTVLNVDALQRFLLPKMSLMKRSANRLRSKTRPVEPTKLDFEFDTDFLQCDEFLIGDLRPNGQRHLMFSTPFQLQLLRRARHQPPSVSSSPSTPSSRWTTTSSSFRWYSFSCPVLLHLQQLLGDVNVEGFVADFETGLWQVLQLVYPGIDIKGCVFHFTQAVWRRIQEEGLSTAYRENDSLHRYLRQLMSLPFLPAAQIRETFTNLQTMANTDNLRAVVNYMDRQWFRNSVIRVELWSVFQLSVRTNNDVEGSSMAEGGRRKGGGGSGKEKMSSSQKKMMETMLASVIEMGMSGENSDIDIVVEGHSFPCHKLLLAAGSPYFKAMFASGMMESTSNRLELPDIDRKTFEAFRKYIYTQDVDINQDNVMDLLRASSIFQVETLQHQCESFLGKEMDTENCLELYKVARCMGCKVLLDKCRPYVMEGFNGLWKSQEFMDLEMDDIESIVKDDELVPVDEEQIVEAVLRQQEFCTSRFHLRNSDDFEEVVLVVTEFDMERSGSFYQDGKCLWAFSMQQSRWYTLAPIPLKENPGNDFAVVSFRNDLYLSGGENGLKHMLKYDSERNEWAKCDNQMKKGRISHMMAAVRECIYVFGGMNPKTRRESNVISSVEEYSIPGRRWRVMGELTTPVHSASTAIQGEKIYIMGGILQDGTLCDAVQMFDTRHRECKIVGQLPSGLSQPLQVTHLNRKVVIVTANGDVYQFKDKPKIEFTQINKLSVSMLPILGFTQYRGQLILLSSTKDKPDCFAKMSKVNTSQTPPRIDQLVPRVNTKPKPIHACLHGIVNKQFLYHTYFQ